MRVENYCVASGQTRRRYIVGQALAWRERRRAAVSVTVANLNSRVNAWWVMCAIFLVTLLSGTVGSLIVFGLISLLALNGVIVAETREYLWSGNLDKRS